VTSSSIYNISYSIVGIILVGNAKRTCACGKSLTKKVRKARVKKCSNCNRDVGNAKRLCACGEVLIEGEKRGGTKYGTELSYLT